MARAETSVQQAILCFSPKQRERAMPGSTIGRKCGYTHLPEFHRNLLTGPKGLMWP